MFKEPSWGYLFLTNIIGHLAHPKNIRQSSNHVTLHIAVHVVCRNSQVLYKPYVKGK
jgi:hypothetical protein